MKQKKVLALILAVSMLFGLVACAPAAETVEPVASETPEVVATPAPEAEVEAKYEPGVYGASAVGNNGRVTVYVEVDETSILAISVDTGYETAGIGDVAANTVADAIVNGQTLVVDTVAGATMTSNAVLAAVKGALAEAGADIEALLTPANPADYNQELEELSADVVVVGGGMAGMVSAVRAAQEGAKVILVERSGILGGAARYAMGWISGAGFRIQKELGVEDSPELFYSDIIGFADGEENVNVDLAKYYAYNSGPAIDWLQDVGVEFKNELNVGIYDPMSVYRVAWGLNNGASLIFGLQKALDEQVAAGNVQYYVNTAGTELVIENGEVTGIRTEDSHANTRTIRAHAVILATGGYGANQSVLETMFDNIACGYIMTAMGDGSILAAQAGAGFHDLDYNPITGGVLPVDGFYSNVRMNVKYNGVIFVDNSGNRVFDEIGANYKTRSDAWIHADENILFGILSESMILADTPVLNMGNSFNTTPDTDGSVFARLVEEGELIFKADTIEELARKMGVDAAALKATIERYNGFVAAGRDEDFGRTANLIAFEEGPFYAIKTIPYAGRSAGGPLCNDRMEVLTGSGEVIPGLYLSGEVVGFSVISGEASVSGMYLGMAATYGVCAGENAADYALSK